MPRGHRNRIVIYGDQDPITTLTYFAQFLRCTVNISFPVINTINSSGYSKKKGSLRKFKSGTSDKSDLDVEKSIKNLYF